MRSNRIWRLNEVKARTGLSRSTLYALIAEGRFPAQFKIAGGHTVGWSAKAVQAWIDGQIAQSETQDAAIGGACA